MRDPVLEGPTPTLENALADEAPVSMVSGTAAARHHESAAEPDRRSPSFHVIAKPIGPICSLDCSYCFYREKEALYPEFESWSMSEAVLRSFTRQYIEAQDVPEVVFAWQGGEPTLRGIDFFRGAVALQQEYAGGKHIANTFQTNGVLLDDAWAAFLAEHQFLVGVSIDGPEALHDRYRLDKAGRGSFGRVMCGIEALKKHGVEFNTLTVVQRDNGDAPLEVYRFLKEIGSGLLQFIPIVERAPASERDALRWASPDDSDATKVMNWSARPRQYGDFLVAIFDEWVRNDVGRVYVQQFEVALATWSGMQAPLCVYRETCGKAMALEHNGDLYSCDHYVYPAHRLGNILETPLKSLANSEQQRQFGQRKRDALPEYCRDCDVLFACRGECPKYRFMRAPDGEAGLNYLCDGLKRFFHHVAPFMRFMTRELAAERAPANVMQHVRRGDLQAAGNTQRGPNAPCTCGSGKKHKKCCGRVT